MPSFNYTFMHLSYPCSLKYTKALCEIAPKIVQRTLLQKDRNGNTPLHTSILCSTSPILTADGDPASEYNKAVFIDKIYLLAAYARNEFAKALTVKNYYGQNPLHILLQHSYVYAERRGCPSYMGKINLQQLNKHFIVSFFIRLSFYESL